MNVISGVVTQHGVSCDRTNTSSELDVPCEGHLVQYLSKTLISKSELTKGARMITSSCPKASSGSASTVKLRFSNGTGRQPQSSHCLTGQDF